MAETSGPTFDGNESSRSTSETKISPVIIVESQQRLLASTAIVNADEKKNDFGISTVGEGGASQSFFEISPPSVQTIETGQSSSSLPSRPSTSQISIASAGRRETNTTKKKTNGRKAEPPIASSRISNDVVKIDSSNTDAVRSKVVPIVDIDTRHEWAAKIDLQSVCGYEPEENLRASDVVETAINIIGDLETKDIEKRAELDNLVREQAHLIDRLAYYKKIFNS